MAAYDPETENYTVSYVDGPFEHDEPPASEKRNFPKGTVRVGLDRSAVWTVTLFETSLFYVCVVALALLQVFEYVKRSHLLLDLSSMYTLRPPRAVILVTTAQLLGSIYASGSNGFGDNRPSWMMSFQVRGM